MVSLPFIVNLFSLFLHFSPACARPNVALEPRPRSERQGNRKRYAFARRLDARVRGRSSHWTKEGETACQAQARTSSPTSSSVSSLQIMSATLRPRSAPITDTALPRNFSPSARSDMGLLIVPVACAICASWVEPDLVRTRAAD